MRNRFLILVLAAIAFVVASPATASAHPLGNFTVNHYHGLAFDPDGLTDSAVIDTAEIPTKQAANDVDRNGDGEADEAERARYAGSECAALAGDLHVFGAAPREPRCGSRRHPSRTDRVRQGWTSAASNASYVGTSI